MRKFLWLLIVAVSFSACGKEPTDSDNTPPTDTPPPPPPVVINDQPDGGKDTTGKWELIHHRDVNGLAGWSQILFPTKDTGYLVNTAWLPTSAYSITFDGGKTWSTEYFMVTNNELLYMIDGTTGMGYRKNSGTTLGSDVNAIFWSAEGIRYSKLVYNATGIGGLQVSGLAIPSREFVYITFTNGESVRLQNPFSYYTYTFHSAGTVPSKTTDIYFPDNATGWLCTSDGEIMATKDSSKTWSNQLTVAGNGFSQIYFIDQKTGWAASYTNSFYKTNDGGASWNKISTPGITSKFVKFVFTTKDRGFFIAGREVFETSDGGLNWVRSCKMGKENFRFITKQGSNVYVLSTGSESRTTPLDGGGTETSSWTYATILKYQ